MAGMSSNSSTISTPEYDDAEMATSGFGSSELQTRPAFHVDRVIAIDHAEILLA
jgi:hypothetical protein